MIQINLDVSGTPTDVPVLQLDTSPIVYHADMSEPGRAIFRCDPNPPPHGFWIHWNGQSARSEMPNASGAYEGRLLPIPLPTLTYAPAVPTLQPLHVVGDHFHRADGSRWWWKGATDFRLLRRFLDGEDLTPILDQRREAGATLVRVVSMKANNTGWELNPLTTPGYWERVDHFFAVLETAGLYCEFTVFADTRALMSNSVLQQAHWAEAMRLTRARQIVLLELVNEDRHSTQVFDPSQFTRPSGVLASHGSGLTDAPPVTPTWDFATYHGRREPPPDARGIVAYDPYQWESGGPGRPGWPKECPYICDEGMKPPAYGFDPAAARAMGEHAALCAGGTFHTSINSDLWDAPTEACARAFFAAIPTC